MAVRTQSYQMNDLVNQLEENLLASGVPIAAPTSGSLSRGLYEMFC